MPAPGMQASSEVQFLPAVQVAVRQIANRLDR